MIEIERKFLVNSDQFRADAHKAYRIVQGFLNTDPERVVRIRLVGDKGFLTIKGKSSEDGLKRLEWETEIASVDAESLLKICEKGIIEKTRYEVVFGKQRFEIDEFHGDNEGLVIAELELDDEDQDFETPEWIGKEVTGEIKYYNAYLSKSPYSSWHNT